MTCLFAQGGKKVIILLNNVKIILQFRLTAQYKNGKIMLN